MYSISEILRGALKRALRMETSEFEAALFPFGTKRIVGASQTLTHEDDGVHFIATAAATFTLPGKKEGLRFKFTQTADANMVISSSGIVADGLATTATVTYSTASHKIGSCCTIECVDINGTLKWLHNNLGGTTATIA